MEKTDNINPFHFSISKMFQSRPWAIFITIILVLMYFFLYLPFKPYVVNYYNEPKEIDCKLSITNRTDTFCKMVSAYDNMSCDRQKRTCCCVPNCTFELNCCNLGIVWLQSYYERTTYDIVINSEYGNTNLTFAGLKLPLTCWLNNKNEIELNYNYSPENKIAVIILSNIILLLLFGVIFSVHLCCSCEV
jgi:hypothetical protein